MGCYLHLFAGSNLLTLRHPSSLCLHSSQDLTRDFGSGCMSLTGSLGINTIRAMGKKGPSDSNALVCFSVWESRWVRRAYWKSLDEQKEVLRWSPVLLWACQVFGELVGPRVILGSCRSQPWGLVERTRVKNVGWSVRNRNSRIMGRWWELQQAKQKGHVDIWATVLDTNLKLRLYIGKPGGTPHSYWRHSRTRAPCFHVVAGGEASGFPACRWPRDRGMVVTIVIRSSLSTPNGRVKQVSSSSVTPFSPRRVTWKVWKISQGICTDSRCSAAFPSKKETSKDLFARLHSADRFKRP